MKAVLPYHSSHCMDAPKWCLHANIFLFLHIIYCLSTNTILLLLKYLHSYKFPLHFSSYLLLSKTSLSISSNLCLHTNFFSLLLLITAFIQISLPLLLLITDFIQISPTSPSNYCLHTNFISTSSNLFLHITIFSFIILITAFLTMSFPLATSSTHYSHHTVICTSPSHTCHIFHSLQPLYIYPLPHFSFLYWSLLPLITAIIQSSPLLLLILVTSFTYYSHHTVILTSPSDTCHFFHSLQLSYTHPYFSFLSLPLFYSLQHSYKHPPLLLLMTALP